MTNSKTTFLLAGHGSRNREGNDEIEKFAAQWRARHPDWRIDARDELVAGARRGDARNEQQRKHRPHGESDRSETS